jgi:hypothetical protein
LTTGKVVDYQPPQPSDDHEWNHVIKRWQLNHAALERVHMFYEKRLRLSALSEQLPELIAAVVLEKKDAKEKLQNASNEIELLRRDLESDTH